MHCRGSVCAERVCHHAPRNRRSHPRGSEGALGTSGSVSGLGAGGCGRRSPVEMWAGVSSACLKAWLGLEGAFPLRLTHSCRWRGLRSTGGAFHRGPLSRLGLGCRGTPPDCLSTLATRPLASPGQPSQTPRGTWPGSQHCPCRPTPLVLQGHPWCRWGPRDRITLHLLQALWLLSLPAVGVPHTRVLCARGRREDDGQQLPPASAPDGPEAPRVLPSPRRG